MTRTNTTTNDATRNALRVSCVKGSTIMTKQKQTKTQIIDAINAHRVANNESAIAKTSKDSVKALQSMLNEYVERDAQRVVTFAQIAREHGVNPKNARSKLRRVGIFATRNARHVDTRKSDRLHALYVGVIKGTLNDDERDELRDIINNATNA